MAIFGIGCAFRGFIAEVMSMAAWILSGLAAFVFWRPVSALLARFIALSYVPQIAAILGIFLLVFLLVKLIERAMKDTLSALNLGYLDSALGFVLGVLEGFIVSAIIVVLIVYQPIWDPGKLLGPSIFYSLIDSFITTGKAAGNV
jgi:membrane protein required for colicin V production